jgi:two-component system, LytTR family, sensor kinase
MKVYSIVSLLKQSKNLLKSKLINHIVFWLVIYAFFLSPALPFAPDKNAIFVIYSVKLLLQMLTAYGLLYILIPQFLEKGKKKLFILSLIIELYIVFILYSTIRYFYLEPTFPAAYRMPDDFYFIDRILDFQYFIKNIIWFFFPAVLLTTIIYYQNQKKILELQEKKKTAELNLLRNQLNPHFLFNTLNNLYALSIKKSDKAPELIAKLSDILDYSLFRCKEDYVLLENEIMLLKNYIDLEKIRYEKRLNIHFVHNVKNEDVKIAPLLLLSFLENAFKHGTSQEINKANITIDLESDKNFILFTIENSKPKQIDKIKKNNRDAIGLINIKKQLDLLYPKDHDLEIKETETSYTAILKLVSK